MHQIAHPLFSESIGSERSITSFHFGMPVANGGTKKVYLQASLHAEELPGMLALYHLIPMLEAAEQAGQLMGEVVVVPVANPIGLAQSVDHRSMGRFDLASSENFNRHYPDIASAIWPTVQRQLGANELANTQVVRKAAAAYLAQWSPATTLQSLRKTLLGLAVEADVVLDLHCDCEALMHLYTEPACWPTLEPLACLLGARAALLAIASDTRCFDEVLSGTWRQLKEMAEAAGMAVPLAQGCVSTTVELRGELDVDHALAMGDANALMHYLVHLGVARPAGGLVPTLPPPLCAATPLSGAQPVTTAVPGVIVFAAALGTVLKKGDLVAQIINPLAPRGSQATDLCAQVDGVLYARTRERYALANVEVANIAGTVPYRKGPLLGY